MLNCHFTLIAGSADGVKEKLVPLIQGPSDTKELHMSRWLNEIRKPESLLAPDLLAFSVQVPHQEDDCRNSGRVCLLSYFKTSIYAFLSSPLLSPFLLALSIFVSAAISFLFNLCIFEITRPFPLDFSNVFAYFPALIVVFWFLMGTHSLYAI